MKEKTTRTGRQQLPSLSIGIGFNRSVITAVLVDDRGRTLAERNTENNHRTTRAAANAVTRSIVDVASSKERGHSSIGSIGISVEGIIDPLTERVTIPANKGWTRVALKQMIEEGLAQSGHDIRTSVHERRAKAQLSSSAHPSISVYTISVAIAAAEAWIGAARGKDDVVYISLGREVDSGIIIGGRPLKGVGGKAGNAGWMALSETLRHGYESRGCLATEAGATSLTRRAIEEWTGNSQSLLGKLIKSDPSQLDAVTIIRAARGGDSLAISVVQETCRWIGRAIANFISLLNPEMVVLGGELGSRLKPFTDDIRKEANFWAAPESAKECRIVISALGENAAALGAAKLAAQAI